VRLLAGQGSIVGALLCTSDFWHPAEPSPSSLFWLPVCEKQKEDAKRKVQAERAQFSVKRSKGLERLSWHLNG
jgi:hypothetical protein